MNRSPVVFGSLLVVLLTACDAKKTGSTPPPPAVPVTVTTLEQTEPARFGRRMGLAQPYREEGIGFEVGGRVTHVVDVGTEVAGHIQDGEGKLVSAGDVLATLDTTRYAQRVKSLELRIASQQAELRAGKIDLEGVAQAQADLAQTTYDRQVKLSTAGTTTKEALDTAKANLDVAQATLELKRAQLLAKEAGIKELEEELRSAKIDLEDCSLRAPYSGRVTKLHVSEGAYVQPGSPVLTLTLIDPINVVLTLSSEDERRLVLGTLAKVYPAGGAEQLTRTEGCLLGRIMSKGAVADPRTRTFQVEVITRNVRYKVKSALSSVQRLVPVLNRYANEPGPQFVVSDAIVKGADGSHYMLVVPREEVMGGNPPKVLKPRKVAVTPKDDYWTVLDWTMRRIEAEGVEVQDVAVRNPTQADHDSIRTDVYQWLVRPGDLVPVAFDMGRLPRGFYVPVTSISELNGETWVFIIEGEKAKRVVVTAHESHEAMRRVEGEGLADGARLVIRGAHYLADGSRVSVQEPK